LRQLPNLSGAGFSQPINLNSRSQIIGQTDLLLLAPSEKPNQEFGLPDQQFGVGWSSSCLWDPARGLRPLLLQPLPGEVQTWASSINNGAISSTGGFFRQPIPNTFYIAGYARNGAGYYRAVVWNANGAVRNLGTLGGNHSRAYAVNDLGWVVGEAQGSGDPFAPFPNFQNGGNYRAFLWKGNRMQDLGFLPNGTWSRAIMINNYGMVVGEGDNSVYGHVFAWTAQNGMALLTPVGGLTSRNPRLNNYGQVVGDLQMANEPQRVFYWTRALGTLDLTSLVFPPLEDDEFLDRALGINDRGMVLARSNHNKLYLLTPQTLQRSLGGVPRSGWYWWAI
jgi:hypothetical protein